MDESKVKNEEPKVLLTQGGDGRLKVIAREQNRYYLHSKKICRNQTCQFDPYRD